MDIIPLVNNSKIVNMYQLTGQFSGELKTVIKTLHLKKDKADFKGVLYPEMPEFYLFNIIYFYNLNLKYVHIHS